MTVNLYFIQTQDRKGYVQSTRDKVNALIEKGEAEWAGSDGDEETDTVSHFADRIEP
jgi:hypothetical protein